MYRRAICVAGAVLATSWAIGAPRAAAADCAASSTAAGLDAFFTANDAAGLAGADYPHAYALPDGRTLWLFQDAFIGADDQLGDDRFAHNAAVVQSGNCFELLPTSGGNGTSWIGSWVERGLRQWFWPLDAEVGADGYLWLFLAEVHNPNGSGAAAGAEPVATWRARYRLPDLELVDLEPAADASRSLFGYSIVSDDDWTYLFGHCYRQSRRGRGRVRSGLLAVHLRGPRARAASSITSWSTGRVPAGRRSASARQPVLSGQRSMPVSVERFGDVYVAASDDDEWFGSDVVIRTAPAPQGPWTEVLRYTPETRCGACNNYGAFILPQLEDDQVVIAHSNNAWDMRGEAFGHASLYRIGVRSVQVPGVPATSSVAAAEQAVESPADAVTSGLLAPQADRPQASPSPETGLDGSQLQVSTAVDPSRWSDNVLRAGARRRARPRRGRRPRRDLRLRDHRPARLAAPPSARPDPRARRGRHPRPHGAATARAGRRRRPLITGRRRYASRWQRRRRRSGGPAGGSPARRAR